MSTRLMTGSLDEMLDALAHVQRRKLLTSLLEHNPQDDTPADVGDWSDVTTAEREIEMAHHHLPKLEEQGYVEWDRRTHDVVKGPDFEEIRPLLELLVDHEDELPDDWA